MGVVYEARDAKLGRTVALKFLPPQWSHDEGAKQRFVREAQAASATNHRNICVIHNIEQARDRKSTRLNSSHTVISYAVFCLKKKKKTQHHIPIDSSGDT